MNVMMMDKTDRLVYMETFLEGKAQGERYNLRYIEEKNNPYKQGTVSFIGWEEGFEVEVG